MPETEKNSTPTAQPQEKGVLAELKKLDATLSRFLKPLIEKTVQNWKAVALGLGAVLAVIAVAAGINAWRERSLAKAGEALGAILVQTGGEARIQALEGFLKDAPARLKTSVLFELAASCLAEKQYDKAAEHFAALAAANDADVRLLAEIGRARSLLLAGKAKESAQVLAALLKGAPEPYLVPVYRQLAAAAEQAGDLQTALSAYQELSAKAGELERQYFEFKISQIKARL
jgi:predicted Zn-dependent protease